MADHRAERREWPEPWNPRTNDDWCDDEEAQKLIDAIEEGDDPEKVSIPYTEWERLRLMENRCDYLEYVLRRIATPKRSDGTYNLSREACEELARQALSTKGDE